MCRGDDDGLAVQQRLDELFGVQPARRFADLAGHRRDDRNPARHQLRGKRPRVNGLHCILRRDPRCAGVARRQNHGKWTSAPGAERFDEIARFGRLPVAQEQHRVVTIHELAVRHQVDDVRTELHAGGAQAVERHLLRSSRETPAVAVHRSQQPHIHCAGADRGVG